MKVFKTIIAGVVVGALSLAMATSAFAASASVSKDGVVTADGVTAATSGQMTVMVVNKAAYDANNVTADDICYIDQVAYSEVATKVASMASRNLKYGDYYVLVGSNSTDLQKINMGSITVGDATVDGAKITWNVTVKAQLMLEDTVTAKLYNTATQATSTAATLWWEDGVITGTGDVTFDVVTNLKDAQYANTTDLEIASGVVSDKN